MQAQPVIELNRCRRRSSRVRVGVPARLWLDVGWQQVICEDVSRDGAGLAVFRPELRDLLIFPQHTRNLVRLTLQLPSGDLDVCGRLVHRGPDRIGIRFARVPTEVRARLNHALAELD